MNEVKIIRSRRRTVAIQITSDMQVIARVPLRMSDRDVRRLIDEKQGWIEKHLEMMRKRQKTEGRDPLPAFTREEIEDLADRALQEIPPRVAYFAEKAGVSYGRITIRNQVTRWGSCSSKGNLNFNCLLMLCPEDVRDYVIVHELCHIKEMNHSPRFWNEVARLLPDYDEQRKWLQKEGSSLIGRLRKAKNK